MKLLIVYGTRPEAIKMAPLVQAALCDSRFETIVCSSGQHKEMLDQVNGYFGIQPTVDLALMQPGQSLSVLTSRCLTGLATTVEQFQPDVVVGQGDTTTAMCSGLTAFYHQLPFVHIEAGLRTSDIHSPFPEELNRRICSLTGALHCAPTSTAADHLLREGYPEADVAVTGNTVIDALQWAVQKERSDGQQWVKKYEQLGDRRMVLITAHRRENHGEGIRQLCDAFVDLSHRYPKTEFVYPVHLNPEIRGPVHERLGRISNIHLVEPAGYAEFVWLMDRCHLILSDSGGVQEEAPTLRKPVLVTRESTERPEALAAGATRLVGTAPDVVVAEACRLLDDPTAYQQMLVKENPYGQGDSAAQILNLIADRWAK